MLKEEFLDISITVQGSNGLEHSLLNSFVMRERLEGNNQYKCELCGNQYRDAEKYCQLKHLPPILTFSLLRFTYDLRTYQRIKETGRFEFPFELDLKDYMEEAFKSQVPAEYSQYELYIIIIHSGSAYGGHYRTYIKDFNNLGVWTLQQPPAEKKKKEKQPVQKENQPDYSAKEICLIYCDDPDLDMAERDGELFNLDYIKYESPLELIKALIYNKHKYELVKIELISADLTKATGMSWNKRYKSKYGAIEKFLRKHEDIFDMCDNKFVALNKDLPINLIASSRYKVDAINLIESCLNEVDEQEEHIEEFETNEQFRWFDLNDAKIEAIRSSQIEKQFEGKESAYMLFYRRKNIYPLSPSREYHLKKVPDWLYEEVNSQNEKLEQERLELDKQTNSIQMPVYLETDFYLEADLLTMQPKFEHEAFMLHIDKRHTLVKDLKELLVNHCTSDTYQLRKETCLNILFDEMPFKLLLCQRREAATSLPPCTSRYDYFIKSVLSDEEPIASSENCFIILSKNVEGWPVGEQFEPIRLIVKYFDEQFKINEAAYAFAKCTQIKKVFQLISEGHKDSASLHLTLIKQNDNEKLVLNETDNRTLADLLAKNGDLITIENNSALFDNPAAKLVPSIDQLSLMNTMHQIYILNCTSPINEVAFVPFSVAGSETLRNIKIMAISAFNLAISFDSCHLRVIEAETNEMLIKQVNKKLDGKYALPGHCQHDDCTLNDILQNPGSGMKLLLCPHAASLVSNNQIVVRCISDTDYEQENCVEIIINPESTRVSDLTRQVVELMQLIDLNDNQQYYLKTINWLGDTEKILNNPDQLCTDIPLTHNHVLIVSRGKVVPPNFYKINLWTSPTPPLTDQTNNQVQLNEFYSETSGQYTFFSELIVSNEMKLEELVSRVDELLGTAPDSGRQIQIRLMKTIEQSSHSASSPKFQLKKCLAEFHKPLKQLHLSQETNLHIELADENDPCFNQGIILLDCIQVSLKSKLCDRDSFKRIRWNVNNGATLSSLKDSVLKAYGEQLAPADLFQMTIAKRLLGKYQWVLLKDLSNSESASTVNKKTNKSGKAKSASSSKPVKSNLKLSPFNLDDGDLIAFTTEKCDESRQIVAEDFLSPEDLDYAKRSNAEIERLRKERSERKANNNQDFIGPARSHRRAEVGIKIQIDNFN